MRAVVVCLLALGVLTTQALAQPVIKVSTENAEHHPQTQALVDFVALANERLAGQLSFKLFPTGKLYRGSNVVNAVSAGRLEIAVPGIWHVSKAVPDLNLFLLPRFYGVSAEENYNIRDGKMGQLLKLKIEENLNVKLLGRWIDLGFAHIFTSHKQITEPEDLKGLKIRVAGGKGNEARIRRMGAEAVTIPWPDFPEKLEQNVVDGTLTTAATINSVKLWEKGIKYAYLDRQYFPQYVPMISMHVWKRLNENQQAILLKCWDDIVDKSRKRAALFQKEALEALKNNGVEIITPSEETIRQTRQKLLEIEPELIKSLRITVID